MMTPTVADLEANYEDALKRYDANSADSRWTIATKQIFIDAQRRVEKKTLRWFTPAELDYFGNPDEETWPTEPREPLALVAVSEPSKVELKRVKWHSYTTLTLDSLITRLQELRKTRSGDTPVMGVELGGYSGLHEVLEEEDCIVIE